MKRFVLPFLSAIAAAIVTASATAWTAGAARSAAVLGAVAAPLGWWGGCLLAAQRPPQPAAQPRPAVDPDYVPAAHCEPFGATITTEENQ